MRISEIADDTAKAGDQLIDAAFKLQDQGRSLRELAQDIRYEQVEPGALSRAIIDLDKAADNVASMVQDALAMLRRLPYEGGRYNN